jgi:hypothetical protein
MDRDIYENKLPPLNFSLFSQLLHIIKHERKNKKIIYKKKKRRLNWMVDIRDGYGLVLEENRTKLLLKFIITELFAFKIEPNC